MIVVDRHQINKSVVVDLSNPLKNCARLYYIGGGESSTEVFGY